MISPLEYYNNIPNMEPLSSLVLLKSFQPTAMKIMSVTGVFHIIPWLKTFTSSLVFQGQVQVPQPDIQASENLVATCSFLTAQHPLLCQEVACTRHMASLYHKVPPTLIPSCPPAYLLCIKPRPLFQEKLMCSCTIPATRFDQDLFWLLSQHLCLSPF